MAEVGLAQGRLSEPGPGRAGVGRAEPGAVIRNARRIWVVGAVHGEAARLGALHDILAGRIQQGDCLVYLGNLLGHGPAVAETVDELLRFRAAFLARPPYVHPDDLVCLRGQQEETWQKLLQIQFAVNPLEVIEWALAHGAEATIRAYGGDAMSARSAARGGALALTRWAGEMRERMRQCPGHIALLNSLRRAARTENGKLLCVNAGIDIGKPFAEQTDGFWWESRGFESIDAPYSGFRVVVRGLDPAGRGFAIKPWSVTVDGGCGFGGSLIALCFAPAGEILDRVEA
jgi:serine/threonine protein phosphatase 1